DGSARGVRDIAAVSPCDLSRQVTRPAQADCSKHRWSKKLPEAMPLSHVRTPSCRLFFPRSGHLRLRGSHLSPYHLVKSASQRPPIACRGTSPRQRLIASSSDQMTPGPKRV